MLCLQGAKLATDCKQCKERQLLRISEGDTAPYEILKWHRTPKRQVTLALRFKSEQGFALLARSKACDRLQAVQGASAPQDFRGRYSSI